MFMINKQFQILGFYLVSGIVISLAAASDCFKLLLFFFRSYWAPVYMIMNLFSG